VCPEPNSGCWIWTAYTNKAGYGQFRYEGKQELAHRVSWFIKNGRTDKCVLHRCDNRPCVNPDHLFEGTQQDNIRDCVNKGRHGWVTGEDDPNAKLTWDLVRAIRKDPRPGKIVTKDYGISYGHYRQLKRGRWWKE
jgi:hypothetical protein